jgi:hypothetical protein
VLLYAVFAANDLANNYPLNWQCSMESHNTANTLMDRSNCSIISLVVMDGKCSQCRERDVKSCHG